MGNEESILKSVEIGEPIAEIPYLSKIWTTVAPAKKEFQQATVFIREFDDDHDEKSEIKKFLQYGIQTLKALRHPRIVKYLDSSINSGCVCLIVERLRPLEYSLDDNFEKDEILSGLCDIFESVSFLHEKAGLSHNNIGPVSVFISSDGSWKLGSFECSQRLENCLHWCQTEFAQQAKDDNFIPPEDQQMMYSNVPVHARDVYGLGKLVDYLMPILLDLLDDEQKNDILDCVRRLTTEEAAKRPSLQELNWKYLFRNDLYDIGDFLRQLPLKDSEEKAAFFRNLVPKLERLSQRVVAKRLSRLLLSRFVLLEPEAVEYFLPRFLSFRDDESSLLSTHLFKQFVIPELKKVFCVHETAIRLALLQYFDQYCQAFDENALRDLILPELLLGMKDANETVVAASMRSLADLVPLLGAEAVTGLKHTKYFSEGKPRGSSLSIQMPDISKLTSVKDAIASSSNNGTFHSPRKQPMAASTGQMKEIKKSPLVVKKIPILEKRQENQSRRIEPEITTPMHPSTSSSVDAHPSPPVVDIEDEKPDTDWIDWDDQPASPSNDAPLDAPSETPLVSSPLILSLPKIQTPQRQESRKQSITSTRSKQLGAEFDILAIEIATPSLEDDLFADLAPKITPARPTRTVIEEKVETTKSTKFQAAAMDDNWNEDGWDDAQLANADDVPE